MKKNQKNSFLKNIVQTFYGFDVDNIQKLEGGFRNSCYKLNSKHNSHTLIVYKKEAGINKLIKNAHTVAKILQARGFQCRVPVSTHERKEYFKIKFEE